MQIVKGQRQIEQKNATNVDDGTNRHRPLKCQFYFYLGVRNFFEYFCVLTHTIASYHLRSFKRSTRRLKLAIKLNRRSTITALSQSVNDKLDTVKTTCVCVCVVCMQLHDFGSKTMSTIFNLEALPFGLNEFFC